MKYNGERNVKIWTNKTISTLHLQMSSLEEANNSRNTHASPQKKSESSKSNKSTRH